MAVDFKNIATTGAGLFAASAFASAGSAVIAATDKPPPDSRSSPDTPQPSYTTAIADVTLGSSALLFVTTLPHDFAMTPGVSPIVYTPLADPALTGSGSQPTPTAPNLPGASRAASAGPVRQPAPQAQQPAQRTAAAKPIDQAKLPAPVGDVSFADGAAPVKGPAPAPSKLDMQVAQTAHLINLDPQALHDMALHNRPAFDKVYQQSQKLAQNQNNLDPASQRLNSTAQQAVRSTLPMGAQAALSHVPRQEGAGKAATAPGAGGPGTAPPPALKPGEPTPRPGMENKDRPEPGHTTQVYDQAHAVRRDGRTDYKYVHRNPQTGTSQEVNFSTPHLTEHHKPGAKAKDRADITSSYRPRNGHHAGMGGPSIETAHAPPAPQAASTPPAPKAGQTKIAHAGKIGSQLGPTPGGIF